MTIPEEKLASFLPLNPPKTSFGCDWVVARLEMRFARRITFHSDTTLDAWPYDRETFFCIFKALTTFSLRGAIFAIKCFRYIESHISC